MKYLLLAILSFVGFFANAQTSLINIGNEILSNTQDIENAENVFKRYNLEFVSKDFDKYVACRFSLVYKINSETDSLALEAEYDSDCTQKIDMVSFKCSENSVYLKNVEKELERNNFTFYEKDKNSDNTETIYLNSKKWQFNIIRYNDGTVNILMIRRTNRVF